MRGEKFIRRLELYDAGAFGAFDQNLDRAIGQFEQLQDGRQCSDLVNVFDLGIIDLGTLLGNQENPLVIIHGGFQRADGFLPADKQRDNHVRVNHHVTQRQDRNHGYRVAGAFRGVFVLLHRGVPRVRF